jgi:hypothetical protein
MISEVTGQSKLRVVYIVLDYIFGFGGFGGGAGRLAGADRLAVSVCLFHGAEVEVILENELCNM